MIVRTRIPSSLASSSIGGRVSLALRSLSTAESTRPRPTGRPLPKRSAAAQSASAASSSRTPPKPVVPIRSAVEQVVKCATESKPRKFVESVDLALQLGVDPRKPNQSVRGVQTLPHGTGKAVRVAVFARGDDAEAAKQAGAAVVGAEDLVAAIQKGELNFDRCVATPDVMPLVSRVARRDTYMHQISTHSQILGPRGLMPNPKMGTVTKDVLTAVKSAMAGQVQFKADRFGMVHVGVGKVDFPMTNLLENIRVFMVALSNAKPEGAKGKYIKSVHISTTMGKSCPVEVATIDPRSSRFMFVETTAEK